MINSDFCDILTLSQLVAIVFASVSNADNDQSAHLCSLIKVCAVRDSFSDISVTTHDKLYCPNLMTDAEVHLRNIFLAD